MKNIFSFLSQCGRKITYTMFLRQIYYATIFDKNKNTYIDNMYFYSYYSFNLRYFKIFLFFDLVCFWIICSRFFWSLDRESSYWALFPWNFSLSFILSAWATCSTFLLFESDKAILYFKTSPNIYSEEKLIKETFRVINIVK